MLGARRDRGRGALALGSPRQIDITDAARIGNDAVLQPHLPTRDACGTSSFDKRHHRAVCADFATNYDESAQLLEDLRSRSSVSAEGVNCERFRLVVAAVAS